MFPPVAQDVDQRVPHFARRPQDTRVIAIPPHSAAAPENAVDGLRDTDGETPNTALERRRPLRLHHQVQMVPLNAELEHPESLRARSPQGDLDRCEEVLVSMGRQAGCRT